jgi:hypothetical protein
LQFPSGYSSIIVHRHDYNPYAIIECCHPGEYRQPECFIMSDYLRTLAVRQLHSLDDHIRVVVIHPNYKHWHILLAGV